MRMRQLSKLLRSHDDLFMGNCSSNDVFVPFRYGSSITALREALREKKHYEAAQELGSMIFTNAWKRETGNNEKKDVSMYELKDKPIWDEVRKHYTRSVVMDMLKRRVEKFGYWKGVWTFPSFFVKDVQHTKQFKIFESFWTVDPVIAAKNSSGELVERKMSLYDCVDEFGSRGTDLYFNLKRQNQKCSGDIRPLDDDRHGASVNLTGKLSPNASVRRDPIYMCPVCGKLFQFGDVAFDEERTAIDGLLKPFAVQRSVIVDEKQKEEATNQMFVEALTNTHLQECERHIQNRHKRWHRFVTWLLTRRTTPYVYEFGKRKPC